MLHLFKILLLKKIKISFSKIWTYINKILDYHILFIIFIFFNFYKSFIDYYNVFLFHSKYQEQ